MLVFKRKETDIFRRKTEINTRHSWFHRSSCRSTWKVMQSWWHVKSRWKLSAWRMASSKIPNLSQLTTARQSKMHRFHWLSARQITQASSVLPIHRPPNSTLQTVHPSPIQLFSKTRPNLNTEITSPHKPPMASNSRPKTLLWQIRRSSTKSQACSWTNLMRRNARCLQKHSKSTGSLMISACNRTLTKANRLLVLFCQTVLLGTKTLVSP